MQEILWVIFMVSGSFLFVFYLLVFLVFLFYKHPVPESNDPGKGVSVIICANNELKNLQSNLQHFLRQDYPEFELIVVDDRSTDGTYDYLYDLKQKEKRLRLVRIDDTPDHINNKKYAITLGIRAAKNDIVLFSDADCRPAGDQWIKGLAAPFSKRRIQIALGYSQYIRKKGFLNAFIRFDTLWTGLQYLGLALLGKPYMGVGRNLAYRKALFLDNRGFGRYQQVTGGDDDLFVQEHASKRNTAVVISPETLVHSQPKERWGAFNIQKRRHLAAGKHYNPGTRILLGAIFLAKILMALCFIPVILSGIKLPSAIAVTIITCFMFLAAILLLKRKTGENTRVWYFPVLGIMYIFYYLTTGVKVTFAKKVRWK